MDYTGFGRNGKQNYKINRHLTDGERDSILEKTEVSSSSAVDWISVVKINSRYLELVDRWYPVKGSAAWQGGMLVLPCLIAIVFLLFIAVDKGGIGAWMFFCLASSVLLFFVWAGWRGMRFDLFRSTHYPIRLCRKERKVYVFRPGESVLEASWDDIVVCVTENKLPLFDNSVDIRAHVLGEDGETVVSTFTLGYPYMGSEEDALQLWEYIRRYMEDPDGVENSYHLTKLCPPIDGRREGLLFGIVRTFAPAANHMAIQLILSPVAALNVLGRWLAMYTSKVPRWPEEIEAVCQIDPDDPYQKDWRSNGKYDFWELGWPVICFVVGLVMLAAGAIWLFKEIF